MRLFLAENMRKVADHLGCDPAGTPGGRLRVAADRTSAAVWVLIINGPATGSRTRFGDAGPALRHGSVHHDFETADLTLTDVMFEHLTQGGNVDEVTATIAERTVGDLNIGSDTHLTGPDASQPRRRLRRDTGTGRLGPGSVVVASLAQVAIAAADQHLTKGQKVRSPSRTASE